MPSTNRQQESETRNRYGPLVGQHVKTILESGLLLDEDYEVLLRVSDFKIYPIKRSEIPLGLIGGTLATIGSIFLARKYSLPVVVVPTIGINLMLLYIERHSLLQKKNRTQVVGNAIKGFSKLQKLHVSIIRYMGNRKEVESKNEGDNLLIYSKNIEEFQNVLVNRNVVFLNALLEYLKSLSVVDEILSNDYEGFKQIDVESVLNNADFSISEIVNVTKKLHDLHTFLSSKFLNYIGIVLYVHLKSSNDKSIENLLDKVLPEVISSINVVYELTKKEFNNLRYSHSKKTEIETRNKSILPRHVTGKLQQTLTGTINNLSIITERSRGVLEEIENEEDPKKLVNALKDLRAHSLATYESLDVLCRLYGILSDVHANKDVSKPSQNGNKSIEVEENIQAVKFDDEIEASEENYELFIPEGDETHPNQQTSYEDHSGVYLGLMLKELRQSLSQHERFIAARTKRGITDEIDDRKMTEISTQTISPAKFDLKNVNSTTGESKTRNEEWKPTPSPRVPVAPPNLLPPLPPPRPSLPPPPPPPAPSFNLSSLQDDEGVDNKRTFFDNIRELSSQVQGSEEVFGDDNFSDDSD